MILFNTQEALFAQPENCCNLTDYCRNPNYNRSTASYYIQTIIVNRGCRTLLSSHSFYDISSVACQSSADKTTNY